MRPETPQTAVVDDPTRSDVGAEPGWSGRTGHVGYLAKMFPRISETFVLREIQALQRHGIPIRIYSLMPPTRDARTHPAAAALMPEVTVLPQPGLATLRELGPPLGRLARSRPRALAYELWRALILPRPRRWRRFFRAVVLADLLHRDRIAHLHAAWAHTPASVAKVACRMLGVPWSMSAHAKDIHLSQTSSLRKKMAAARFTSACTRAHRDLLVNLADPGTNGTTPERDANAGGNGKRITHQTPPHPTVLLHYHGVDTTFFAAHGRYAPDTDTVARHDRRNGTPPVILSVGRLVQKKGFDLLLGAAGILRERGTRFRVEIIGDGPLRAELEQRIRSLGLQEIVELRGMLVLDEVRDAYAGASCVVLASRVTANGDRDGIPNTLAEAMASGVPVVATRLPSIEEIVEHGETGLLVPPEDPDALAEAIERLLSDPTARADLGRRGCNSIRRTFDGAACGAHVADRFRTTRGIERLLYLTADRGVPVRGAKGASVHVRSVVEALRQLGVGVRIVTTRTGSKHGPRPAAPLVTTGTGGSTKRLVSRLCAWTGGGVPLERAILRLLDNLPVYREVSRQAAAMHADAIYERYALTAVAGSLLARRLKVPHILEVNAPLADEEARYRSLRLGHLAHALERWILRRADRVVVVSRALEEHARRLGVDPGRILVLPNAVDPVVFHPRRDGTAVRRAQSWTDDFVVGFAGTLKPWHGLQHLLHAFPTTLAAIPTARLLIIGDGPERDALTELAERLGVANHVRFVGHVPHAKVGDCLAACDVLVAPYGPIENHWFSPLKVAEYLAVGRPVIASEVGQLAEHRDRQSGVMLVPPGDQAALAAALSRLAIDDVLRRQLQREATTAPRPTWTDLVREVLTAGESARRENWGWR